MRRPTVVWILGVLIATMLIAASPLTASAAPVTFGAKLDNESQPSNAENGRKCDQNGNIPTGSTCTWVGTEAYHNGSNFKAPKDGTIGKLKLVACRGGSFTLQIAHKKAGVNKYKVVRNGPTITYASDPRQVDGNPDTFCGGDGGDDYTTQAFFLHPAVHVNKGDLIAVKAKRLGPLYCAGGNGVQLYAPPLSPGGGYTAPDDSDSCDLMITLVYK